MRKSLFAFLTSRAASCHEKEKLTNGHESVDVELVLTATPTPTVPTAVRSTAASADRSALLSMITGSLDALGRLSLDAAVSLIRLSRIEYSVRMCRVI